MNDFKRIYDALKLDVNLKKGLARQPWRNWLEPHI